MDKKQVNKRKRKRMRARKRKAFLRALAKEYKEIDPVRMVVMLVLTFAVITVSIFLFVSRPTPVEQLEDSYLDTVQDMDTLKQNIKTDFSSVYKVENYTIYGESLKFYHGTSLSKMDALQGTNVTLRNIETKDEMNFTFGAGADDGITLGNIKPGLYEIYVYDHYTRKRVYFTDRIESSVFEGLRRNKSVKHVQLIADKDILKDYDVSLNKNYAFLSVTDTVPKVDTIDILIDPCTPSGKNASSSQEQKESYAFAERVKKELESYGLKVELTRTKNQKKSYYGKNGRVAKGYKGKAKVFLSLGYITDEDADRPMMVVSPYTSGSLANSISYSMQNKNIHVYDTEDTTSDDNLMLEEGIVFDTFIDKDIYKGTKTKYERYPQLRESGGANTFAGQYEKAENNASYSHSFGMYGIYFQFVNPESNDSVNYYQKYKKKMAKALAQGIARYFNIEDES